MHKKLHQNDYICQHFSWLKYIFCLGIQPVHAFPVGLIYMINYFKYYSLSLISPSFQYPIVLDSVSFLLRTWIPCNTLSCRRPFYSRGLPHTEKKSCSLQMTKKHPVKSCAQGHNSYKICNHTNRISACAGCVSSPSNSALVNMTGWGNDRKHIHLKQPKPPHWSYQRWKTAVWAIRQAENLKWEIHG